MSDEQRQKRADRARGRFHLRVGQAGTAAKKYDDVSRPLFPFWMLMECEGTLAAPIVAQEQPR